MNHRLSVISYTLASMAGICMISGLLIIKGGHKHHDRRSNLYGVQH